MKLSPARFVWILAALAGCASSGTTLGARTASTVEIYGPHVAAGTRFSVRLSTAHDPRDTSRVGRFEGITETSLRSPQGAMIVPAGATVRGDLVWSARRSRWILGEATIHSIVGPLAVRAAVQSNVVRDGQTGDPTDASVAAQPAEANARSATRTATGASWAPPRIAFDRDQSVELVLTRAILAPGASVLNER